jgi:hypothetical protein
MVTKEMAVIISISFWNDVMIERVRRSKELD